MTKRVLIHLLALCLVLVCGCTSPETGGSGKMEYYGDKTESQIVPRVKEQYVSGDILNLTENVKIYVDCDEGKVFLTSLSIFYPDISFTEAPENDALVVLKHDGKISAHDEFYDLTVKPDSVSVIYKDRLGARNAASALALQMTLNDGKYTVPCDEICDYPDNAFRSSLVESSGRVWKDINELKEIITRAALCRYNYIHFHFFEYMGSTVPLDCLPKLPGFGPDNLKYTKDEIRELVAFSDNLGIKLIPGIEMPAHSEALLTVSRDLRCSPDPGTRASTWVCCAGSEKTYEMFEAIIREVADLFPCEYIHIGADELDFGEGSGWEPSWMNCKRCREFCNKEGYKTEREIYYHMIRKIHDYASSCGRKIIMFNDQIDISEKPDIPNDIIIEFWRIATEGRGPVEGCTLQKFIDNGFSIINAFYPELYVDFEEYASAESINKWVPQIGDAGIVKDPEGLIIGAEFCSWETHRHFAYTTPSAFVLYGDRFWNSDGKTVPYDSSYGAMMTRAILGADAPSDFNVFEYIGSVFPPRDDRNYGYPENVTADAEAFEAALSILGNFRRTGYGAEAAKAYRVCVGWVKEASKTKVK